MKFIFKIYLLALVGLLAILTISCKDVTNPHEHNEGELFTTVRLIYVNTTNPSDTITVTFKDSDGEGGADPTVHDTLRLQANTAYNVTLILLDESNPADVKNMGEEILEEATDHQVYYTTTGNILTVSYTDLDPNGLPLGLSTSQTSGVTSAGTLTVTLKHQPGVKSVTSTIKTGETDVEVTFSVEVQ